MLFGEITDVGFQVLVHLPPDHEAKPQLIEEGEQLLVEKSQISHHDNRHIFAVVAADERDEPGHHAAHMVAVGASASEDRIDEVTAPEHL